MTQIMNLFPENRILLQSVRDLREHEIPVLKELNEIENETNMFPYFNRNLKR